MAKFDNAKVGDRLWSIKWNCWGTVIDIHRDEKYPIYYNADVDAFTTVDYNGRSNKDGVPILYWNEVHLPTDEEDKKLFNLVQYLQENLEPCNYTKSEVNRCCSICYDYDEEFYYIIVAEEMTLGTLYFSLVGNALDVLTEMKIKPDELQKAFKELGWLWWGKMTSLLNQL